MNKKPEKFIIDVAPLIRLSLSGPQAYSYLHNQKLAPGTLVEIPLFKRKVLGMVLGARDDFSRLGNIELKNIAAVVEENFLTEKQLLLAQFISDYYISPLGVVLKNFVPKRVKSRKYKVESRKYEKKEITLTKEQQLAINKITSRSIIPAPCFLLYGPAGSGKTEIYIHSILQLATRNSQLQFLILVPEKTLLPQALERYGQYFSPEEIVMLSSDLSKGQFYSHWQRIKSGEAKVIIGTRMAVFAPFKKLGLVVIDEEQDMSYKQWDMNPRYDARTVAEKLAQLHHCPLVRGSATPSIESYYRAKNGKLILLKIPPLKLNAESGKPAGRQGGHNVSSKNEEDKTLNTFYAIPATVIVDMKKERWVKNYGTLSKKLIAEVAYALKNRQQVVLLVNRQGLSHFSICESCKTVLKCPKCDRALILGTQGNYYCAHCAYKTSIIPECQKCGGVRFKNVGVGTQKVKTELESHFSSARILVADTQTTQKIGSQEKIYQEFSRGEADILIGTQMISKGWDLPRVSLVGIIDTDNLLTFPDFMTEEKAFQLIRQVSGRTGRLGARFPGLVLIQTFNPLNKLIQFCLENNFEGFYESQITERTALNLPPVGNLIKLTVQNLNFKKVEESAAQIYERLQEVPGIKITEPENSYLPKIRGRYRKQLLIKFKEEFPEKLRTVLNSLGSDWLIDRDPISSI